MKAIEQLIAQYAMPNHGQDSWADALRVDPVMAEFCNKVLTVANVSYDEEFGWYYLMKEAPGVMFCPCMVRSYQPATNEYEPIVITTNGKSTIITYGKQQIESEYKGDNFDFMEQAVLLLGHLASEQNKVQENTWPSEGDTFHFVDFMSGGMGVKAAKYRPGTKLSDSCRAMGNFYQTKEQAERVAKAMVSCFHKE